MGPRQRVLLLIGIMAGAVLAVESITIAMLYGAAFGEERARLVETVQSHARLIEAVARFDAQYSTGYPEGSTAATLSQIIDAHSGHDTFGKTGEFTLARREGTRIVFLLAHRFGCDGQGGVLPSESGLAEPMQMALKGKSGTMVGLDYRGERVLAAFQPVRELNLGIVAKVDLKEIRAPFLRAGILSGAVGIILVLIGTALFLRITNPLLQRLQETVAGLEAALGRVKMLSGLLPICSSCKKVRDDTGYWSQIESYVRDHSEAEFSHGLCPECAKRLYPDFDVEDADNVLAGQGKTAEEPSGQGVGKR